jgi:hypothetical protein
VAHSDADTAPNGFAAAPCPHDTGFALIAICPPELVDDIDQAENLERFGHVDCKVGVFGGRWRISVRSSWPAALCRAHAALPTDAGMGNAPRWSQRFGSGTQAGSRGQTVRLALHCAGRMCCLNWHKAAPRPALRQTRIMRAGRKSTIVVGILSIGRKPRASANDG